MNRYEYDTSKVNNLVKRLRRINPTGIELPYELILF